MRWKNIQGLHGDSLYDNNVTPLSPLAHAKSLSISLSLFLPCAEEEHQNELLCVVHHHHHPYDDDGQKMHAQRFCSTVGLNVRLISGAQTKRQTKKRC